MNYNNTKELSDEEWQHYLSYTPAQYIQIIEESLQKQNRYFAEHGFLKLIMMLANSPFSGFESQRFLPSGFEAFRARIYTGSDAEERFLRAAQFGSFSGYDKENSGAPPASSISIGRANPQGIRYIYLSSDYKTSIFEVRASLHEYVSVATIKFNHDVHLFNLASRWSGIDASEKDRSEWINEFTLHLVRLFQRPHQKDGDYLLCQYICAYLQSLGFDGVLYRSSKTNCNDYDIGFNLVIFNPDYCVPISSQLYLIRSINMDLEHSKDDFGRV